MVGRMTTYTVWAKDSHCNTDHRQGVTNSLHDAVYLARLMSLMYDSVWIRAQKVG